MTRNKSNILTLSKEELETFTKESRSWKGLLEKCGYTTFRDNTALKRKLNCYNIDFTHLPTRNLSSQRNITKEKLEEYVKNSTCWKDLLKLCGYNNFADNRYVQKKVNKFNIDVNHFQDYYSKNKQYTLEEIFCENSLYQGHGSGIKAKLIKYFNWELKCQNIKCVLKDIDSSKFKDPDTDKQVPLLIELDHINGDNTDNRIENLRFLCVLCHSLTSTYRTKNKTYKEKEEIRCIDCNKIIYKDSLRCIDCEHIKQRKVVNRPSLEQINNDLQELKTMVAVGKKYDVSDNTIRKWIRHYKNNASV